MHDATYSIINLFTILRRYLVDYRSNAVLTYVSILHRNTNRYFSGLLEKHRIGSGQQFFLLRIFEN